MRCLLICIGTLAFITGCQPKAATTTPALPSSYGRFEGDVLPGEKGDEQAGGNGELNARLATA